MKYFFYFPVVHCEIFLLLTRWDINPHRPTSTAASLLRTMPQNATLPQYARDMKMSQTWKQYFPPKSLLVHFSFVERFYKSKNKKSNNGCVNIRSLLNISFWRERRFQDLTQQTNHTVGNVHNKLQISCFLQGESDEILHSELHFVTQTCNDLRGQANGGAS